MNSDRIKNIVSQQVKEGERSRLRQRDKQSALSLSPFSVSSGFTLIELLVVMVIIGLLAALVAPRFVRQEEKAKIKAAKAQIELLGTALDTLRLDAGRYPTTQEGLDALRRKPGGLAGWDGPYLKKEIPLDPWRKPYVYRSPGQNGPYDLISYGADGTPGGEGDNQDITSWDG
ncbi:MAG: type II secretion system major pseudopilin GspG [Deltaproteobacteria bacterium]|nr:type II secretion system major pseudopilin GspG [Deltaproteobacteria bacterium]